MTLVNNCLRNTFKRLSFLHSFRNVKKLKTDLLATDIKYGGRSFPFHCTSAVRCDSLVSKNFPLITCTYFVGSICSSNLSLNNFTILCSKKESRRRVHKKMGEIKENVLTIPNALCLVRMLSTPVLGYLVLSELYALSFGLFLFAGFTDWIDGYIARNFPNQQSMIGSFLDPAADKLLIATLFVTLTVNGLIPVPLTSLIISRDAFLMAAGFYIRYVSLPPPKTLTRYFDMSLITAKLSPTAISKANTLVQLCLVAASLAAPVFSYVDHSYLHGLWYITATSTVVSAASYVYYNRSTYKLLKFHDKTKS